MESSKDKYAFLKMKAPASYVAGLGRGASGFTTRSDIGPAREQVEDPLAPGAEGGEAQETNDEARFQDPENETGLFSGLAYTADDDEADMVYLTVDHHLDQRRRKRREQREKEEEERERKERPTIQSQFADLKRGLADMTDSEWANLPEVNNLTGRSNKKGKHADRSFVVPDMILRTARDNNSMDTTLDAESSEGGTQTSLKNLAEIGQARGTMLKIKLEQMEGTASSLASQSGGGDTVNGSSTAVDPKGYLTGLDSLAIKSAAEIGDIKRARALLQSLIKTNPKHAPGWVAAAWLENVAGNVVQARKLIAQGCEHCPKSEDVWIAASELNTPENAKVVLANAVSELPESVRIWMRAVELEPSRDAKRNVLKKALLNIPASVKLWKAAVSLEDEEDARTLLARAVEVIPHSQELWLALARLETPDKARQVLNKARKTIPTSHEIWIAAGRLQEQEGNIGTVDNIIAHGVASLKSHGVDLGREAWIHEAERCEAQESPVTAAAIIKSSLALGIEDEDRMDTWLEDAKGLEKKGMVHSARAVYEFALGIFPHKQIVWRRAADLEREKGTRETLLALLDKAVKSVPQAEVLWLMKAKEQWLSGDVPGARKTLTSAFELNSASESIWLAAIKLEAENNEINAAKQLLERARHEAGTERIWIRSAVFERQHVDPQHALERIKQGLVKFPTSPKLHMMHGQVLLQGGSNDKPSIQAARKAYAEGVKACPDSESLWILSSRLEEMAGVRIKARALLEAARKINPDSEEIWLESVMVEDRDGSNAAKRMLAQALQHLPTSGALHAYSVWSEPRPTRKTKAIEALKKTSESPIVILTVARLFWAERKIDKARQWFGRAIAANGDYGDGWAWWYRFELNYGNQESRDALIKQCEAADPHHGPYWQAIAKDPSNSDKKIEDIIKLTAVALEIEDK